MNVQANLLAETFSKTREISMLYLNKLSEADPEKVVELNGIKLNSIYWLAAHLTWAEHRLVLEASGGTSLTIPWLNHYGIGSDGTLHAEHIEFKIVLEQMQIVHIEAMKRLTEITDEVLAQPAAIKLRSDGTSLLKSVIQHAIRHEGTHAGHLGWLAKLNGVKTF